MPSTIVVCNIPRARIEALDCSALVKQFDCVNMTADQLKVLHGRVVFLAAGYDDHPDELYAIADVRLFARHWRESWPNLLYFGSLADESLKTWYLSLLESIECIRFGDARICRAQFNRSELASLLAADLNHSDLLCERAGISTAARLNRARAVLRYFGFTEGEP